MKKEQDIEVNQSSSSGGEEDIKENTTNHARAWIAVLVVVLVVLAAGGFFGWRAYDSHRMSVAQSDCSVALNDAKTARRSHDSYAEGEASDAMAIDVKQLKDKGTHDALARALERQVPALSCSAVDCGALEGQTTANAKGAAWYRTQTGVLKTRVKAVLDSRTDLLVDQAKALLKSSDGKVADNETREALAKAIDARDEKAIASATKQVNDSVAAKRKADEEAKARAEAEAAAAAAAQAQAAQAAQNTVPSYTPSYSTGGGSQSYQQSAPSTPAPATGQGSGTGSGSGSSGDDGWINPPSNSLPPDQQCLVFGCPPGYEFKG